MKNSNQGGRTYVAFIQGINIEGKSATTIRMDELRNAFKIFGYKNAETISITGNVIFSAPEADLEELANSIERNLRKRFNLYTPVAVRGLEDIKQIIESNPFDGVDITENTRLFVSFLCEPLEEKIRIKKKSESAFKILKTTNSEVYIVLNLTDDINTNNVLNFVSEEFRKRVVTRNWNTIVKFQEK